MNDISPVVPSPRWKSLTAAPRLALLAVILHVGLMLHLAWHYSVTVDEAAHIASGVMHWETGQCGEKSGLLAVLTWRFEPTLLSHGVSATPDLPCPVATPSDRTQTCGR